jgi:hypothetical protein
MDASRPTLTDDERQALEALSSTFRRLAIEAVEEEIACKPLPRVSLAGQDSYKVHPGDDGGAAIQQP